jgi:hypothetical protein
MASPTNIEVGVDEEEYSRFEVARDTITVSVTPTGAGLSGEFVDVALIKARRNRDQVVATKRITLTGATAHTTTFYLPEIVDENSAPRVRRGVYTVRATSVSDTDITADSDDFYVSLITVDKFKADYLHGVNLLATNQVSVKEQPSVITGVTVSDVSRDHKVGWITLSYNYSEDEALPPNVTRSLSWCGGPQTIITSNKTRYILRKGSSQTDYIEVKIPDVSALPESSKTEDLLIEKSPISIHNIRDIINNAISWIEDSELSVFLEPTVVVTELDPDSYTYDDNTDIPTVVDTDWDKKVDCVTYYKPAANKWLNFRMPYYPLIRFDRLYGKVADTEILQVDLQWVESHEKFGFVELVPISTAIGTQFVGLMWVDVLHNNMPIPNFWNFKALVGYRDLPQVLLELVAKKAAIDALTIIGQALRPMVSSTSVSRDGISESISYLTTQNYGIFTATIKVYKEWIEENLTKLKGVTRGNNMCVL